MIGFAPTPGPTARASRAACGVRSRTDADTRRERHTRGAVAGAGAPSSTGVLSRPSARVRARLNGAGAAVAAGAMAGVAWLGFAIWIGAHPVSVGSDDALFFVRGVERMSVLEMRPHFPGYPAFVLVSRLLAPVTGSAAGGVALLTAAAALALPLLGAAWVRCAGGTAVAAAACAMALVGQPLGPTLALSLLSDGVGLACLVGHLVALERRADRVAGGLLGLAVSARPSYAVMLAASLLALALLDRSRATRVATSVAIVGAASVLVVIGADGPAYLAEGARFLRGHFLLWGAPGVAPGQATWAGALRALLGGGPGLVLAGLAIVLAGTGIDRRRASLVVAAAMWAAYAGWMLGAQNPAHLRHAAPLVAIGIPLVVLATRALHPSVVPVAHAALVAWMAAVTLPSVGIAPAAAPLEQAASSDALPPGAVLLTQRGVELLRDRRPDLRIHDLYYAASAARAVERAGEVPVMRLSGSSVGDCYTAVASFDGRYPGEDALTLYARDRAECDVSG